MGAASAAGASGAGAQQDAGEVLAAKKLARLQELQQTYQLVRAQPYTMAIVMKLNYVPPPPPPVEEEPVEQVIDPKAAKEAAKGKGKGKK